MTTATPADIPIDEALRDPALLGAALGDALPWATWIAALKAAFARPLDDHERPLFAAVAGGREAPGQRVREFWAVAGRRGGKSRMAAALAAYAAAFLDHRPRLAAGETGYVLVVAPTQAQATVTAAYVRGFFEASPVLRQMIVNVSGAEVRLAGNVVIGVHAANYRTVRGRTLLAVVLDEAAFFRDETSAVPDVEIYRAVLPSLATTDGLLVGISSPYRRTGLLHQKHRDHFGRDDADVLVIQAPTEVLNPTINAATVERARRADPEAARAEWDAEFRSDIAALFDDTIIDAAIDPSRPRELPYSRRHVYVAFVDASAGRHDAFTLCIGHAEGVGEHRRFVADVVRAARPPFDPRFVAHEYAALAKDYRCSRIVGDAYAGEWVRQAFIERGMLYERAPLPKSALYLEAVPLFMRGAVSIPDMPALVRELRLLERRTHRSGRDSVDHPAAGSDDMANALAGAAYMATHAPRRMARMAPGTATRPAVRLGVPASMGDLIEQGEALLARRRTVEYRDRPGGGRDAVVVSQN